MGFIYQNIPAFELTPGDILAFDLGKMNDFDIELDIHMAATTVNGGEEQAGEFTRIVSNTQTPENPRGDTEFGNFELRFTVENAFSFPGGGLIIRFSNGSEAYRADVTCDESQVGVVGSASDSSGYFVRAFWDDPDGESPWTWSDFPNGPLRFDIIGGFQVVTRNAISVTGEFVDANGAAIVDATVGETVVYRVTARNQTKTDATGILVTATLASEFSFLQADATPAGAAVYADGPPKKVEWTVGSLAAGAQASVDIELAVQFDANQKSLTNSAGTTAIAAPFELSADSRRSELSIGDIYSDALDSSGSAISFITIGYLLLLIFHCKRRVR